MWARLLVKRLAWVDDSHKRRFKVFVDNCLSELVDGTWVPPKLGENPTAGPSLMNVHSTPPGGRQYVVIDPPVGVSAYQPAGHALATQHVYQTTAAASVSQNRANNTVGNPTPPMDRGIIQLSPGQGGLTYHQLQTVPYSQIAGNSTTALMYRGGPTGARISPLDFASSPKK